MRRRILYIQDWASCQRQMPLDQTEPESHPHIIFVASLHLLLPAPPDALPIGSDPIIFPLIQ